MSVDKLNNIRELKHWHGDLNVEKYVFTVGEAGEAFFNGLKEGKIIVSKCSKCGTMYLPPRGYCERCFSEIKEFVEIPSKGYVHTYTIQRKDKNGKSLEKPIAWALIKFPNVEGGLIHKLGEVNLEKLEIGLEVEPVFKPKEERRGHMSDILYFKPLK